MSLFVYQPNHKAGTYNLVDGPVNVAIGDSSNSDKLGSDALTFENSLTDATRPFAKQLLEWLTINGYTKSSDQNSIPTYTFSAPRSVKAVTPIAEPPEAVVAESKSTA